MPNKKNRKIIEEHCRDNQPQSKHFFSFMEVTKLSSAIFLFIISFSILFLLWRLIESNMILYKLRGFDPVAFEWWFAPELWLVCVVSIVTAAIIIRSMDGRFAKEYLAITGIAVIVFIIINGFFITSELKSSINAQKLLDNLPHRQYVESMYEKSLTDHSEIIGEVAAIEKPLTLTLKNSYNQYNLKDISLDVVSKLAPGKIVLLKYDNSTLSQVKIVE
jgi:hypothetical protein